MSVFSQLPGVWQSVQLGEVAKFINGDRGKNYPSQDAFVSAGIPFINAGHIKNGNIDFDSMNYISKERFDLLGSGKVQKNDILYCLRGSLGKTAVIRAISEGAIASSLVIIRSSDKIDTNYLYHYLVSPRGKAEIWKNDNGSSQPNLSAKSVKGYKIPLPPLEEQKRIAAILDKADAIRRSRQKAIALTEELLRSTFLDMFGDPVTNPKGWDIFPIELLASNSKNSLAIGPFGSNLKVDDYKEKGHPVVFVKDVQENVFNKVSNVFVDSCKFEQLKSHRIYPNDVVATKMGLPPCKASVYPDFMPIGIITADIIKVTLDKEKALPEYVSAAINSDYCKRQVAQFTEGITRPKVTLRDFKKLLIPCPPINLQKDWHIFCTQQHQVIKGMKMASDTTSSLFNSLLQKAFRGEL